MSALHRQITAHNRFAGEAASERGAANEARLLDAVLALRAGGASWILDARRATPEEDAAGADVVVTTDAGTLYLQSKSSRAGLAKFSAKARTIRVEAVVVSLDDATTRMRALVALSALRSEAMRLVARPVVAPTPRGTSTEEQLAQAAARKAERVRRHLELNPNDRQPPSPPPLPLEEQIRRAVARGVPERRARGIQTAAEQRANREAAERRRAAYGRRL